MPDSIFRAYPAIAHALTAVYLGVGGTDDEFECALNRICALSLYEADQLLDSVLPGE